MYSPFQNFSKDPNVVQSAEEEEAIARAIANSLEDVKSTRVYPSASATPSAAPPAPKYELVINVMK